jgi:hypothetical protein
MLSYDLPSLAAVYLISFKVSAGLTCNDPVEICSGVMVRRETREYDDGRGRKEMDGANYLILRDSDFGTNAV